jgi:hypothetical protein
VRPRARGRAPAFARTIGIIGPILCVAAGARAEDAGRVHQGHLLRVATGVAYLRESWTPSGGSADAVHTGWGPALEVTVGKFVRPRLVLAGSLQLAGIIDRDETTLGTTYALEDTVHFVDTLSALADFYPDPLRGLHFGGSLGLAGITELDTHMGGTQTSFGFAAALHAGYERFISKRWSAGGLARLAFHHYATDTPPPDASTNGLLASLLLAFTFD